MIKLKNRPDKDVRVVSVFIAPMGGNSMNMRIYSTMEPPYMNYIEIDGEWWKVSGKEIDEEHETDTFIKAMRHFGLNYRKKTTEETLSELGLLHTGIEDITVGGRRYTAVKKDDVCEGCAFDAGDYCRIGGAGMLSDNHITSCLKQKNGVADIIWKEVSDDKE